MSTHDNNNSGERDELLDSNYDGIEEYDNDLPRWWLWLFYITILICPVYIWYWHFGPGLLPHAQLEEDMQELADIRARFASAAQAAQGATDEQSLLAFISNQDNIAAGAKLYAEKCLPCHGAKGEGLIGPNLTDNHWIHGGSALDIQRVIREGVPAKGMIAWKEMMPADQINQTVAFLWSIRDTNIPGKAPEGSPVS
jgi:cytochrome c oxidase cbb3-type subunit 3